MTLRTSCSILLYSSLCVAVSARAEFSCAPQNSPDRFTGSTDSTYQQALSDWSQVTRSRYIEGDGSCPAVSVPGYEGFPTRLCTYSSADSGEGHFQAFLAQAIVLDPSAKQLAQWSIRACRINGVSNDAVASCLGKLRKKIVAQNGAQFPVAGSVVESICNSSPEFSGCDKLAGTDPNRAPRNTLFRDGVSVSYRTLAHWTAAPLSDDVYRQLFDTVKSDPDIEAWYLYSRVSSAERKHWVAWRHHTGKPVIPDGAASAGFDLDGAGWGLVSREVHKHACKGEDNELFDALVYGDGLAE